MLERFYFLAFALPLLACGGDVSTPADASSTDSGASDAADASPPIDAHASDGGIIPQTDCARSLGCGSPGQSCPPPDGGCSSTSCYCQSYGQPRCLDLSSEAGAPGAMCTSSTECGAGLTCVQFGPDAFCFYCGD